MNESENNVFRQILAGVELSDDAPKLQSLEKVKDAILSSLFTHLSAFDNIDVNNEDVHANACIALTDYVGYDFEQMDGLDYGDEVVSVDELVLLVVDIEEGTTETFVLDSSAELRGDVRDLIVNIAPDIESALDRTTEYDTETNPGPIVPFGVGLVLQNVIIRHTEEEPEFVPNNRLVFIPMGYAPFPMKKVA